MKFYLCKISVKIEKNYHYCYKSYKMFATKVNQVIISEMRAFFDHVSEKYPDISDIISPEEFQEELKVFLDKAPKISDKTPGKKVTKEKKKREVKEIPEDERCLALKKDTTQCNGKRYPNGEDPELCTLHNRSGTTYGRISDKAGTLKRITDDSNLVSAPDNTSVKSETSIKNKRASIGNKYIKISSIVSKSVTCPYEFTKGKSKGEVCGKLVVGDSVFCKSHDNKADGHGSDRVSDRVESDNEQKDLFGAEIDIEDAEDDCSDVDRYEYHSDA